MSWDIMLIRTKHNSEPWAEIDESNLVAFDRKAAAAKIRDMLPEAEGDDTWLDYDSGTYDVSVNLGTEIMLHVHIYDDPEDAVLGVVRDLCALLECRAFDTTRGEFLTWPQGGC